MPGDEEIQEIHECGVAQEILDEIMRGTDTKYYAGRESRIAKKALVELVKAGRAEFLFLRDDEVRNWWAALITDAKKKVEVRKEKIRVYTIKKAAWDKLTPDERTMLGMRKPNEPKDFE